MCSNGFSEIRRGMDCGKEAGNFLEDFMNDGPVAQHLEEQDNRNRDILRRLKEIDAPAELKEEVRDAVAQNANTVLVLIDEVRRVYPDYRLYPACEVERLIDILEIIACAGRDEQRPASVAQGAQIVQQLRLAGEVQGGRWLVQQQQIRTVGNSAADHKAFFHSAGHPGYAHAQKVRDAAGAG